MLVQRLERQAPIETRPLRVTTLPRPEPGPGEVRIRVTACGVCRTDLHVIEGDLRAANLPLVPGHQVVGVVDALGAGAGARGHTRVDGRELLEAAAEIPIRPRVTRFPLSEANEALIALKSGRIDGSGVLVMGGC